MKEVKNYGSKLIRNRVEENLNVNFLKTKSLLVYINAIISNCRVDYITR